MGLAISWGAALLGDAVADVAPTTTRDIPNSIDATDDEEVVLLFQASGGASPSIEFEVYIWDGSSYVALGESYLLDAEEPAVSLRGGVFYAIYSTGGITGAPATWSVTPGSRPTY